MAESLYRLAAPFGNSRTMPQPSLSARSRIALVIVVTILIAVRMPDILLHGRFWAEEGRFFLYRAWSLPFSEALLAPLGGYLNLPANLAGILAWYVPPLDWAPYASTIFALLFQICPAILLLSSRLEWLNRPPVMVAGVLLIVLLPASEEVWLSSIGTQVHLTLCAAIILALETRADRVGAFRLGLLAWAALSGPGAWLLAPLFAVRASVDRSVIRLWQVLVLGAGVCIQIAFFYSREPGREYSMHPILFMDVVFIKHLLVSFCGPAFAYRFGAQMIGLNLAGHLPWWPAAVVAGIVVVWGVALVVDWRSEPFWLALAAAVIAIVSFFGALGGTASLLVIGYNERYTLAPQALISLAVLGFAATHAGRAGALATMCVVWFLVIDVSNYFVPSMSAFAHGPDWRHELALHRSDPSHNVAI